MNLALDLTPAFALNTFYRQRSLDLVAFAAQLTALGIYSHSLQYLEEHNEPWDKQANRVNASELARFTVEAEIGQDLGRYALDLKPAELLISGHKAKIAGGLRRGLDVGLFGERIEKTKRLLHEAGVDVVLLVEPDIEKVRAVYKLGFSHVELLVSDYAQQSGVREKLYDAMRLAKKLSMTTTWLVDGADHFAVRELRHLYPPQGFRLGHNFYVRSLHVGTERALDDFHSAFAHSCGLL